MLYNIYLQQVFALIFDRMLFLGHCASLMLALKLAAFLRGNFLSFG